jgi:hypothetical protein
MRGVVRFYQGQQDKPYPYEEIIGWTDSRLQARKNYINWLFPLETDAETKLNKALLYKFKTNRNIRMKVVRATLRMMSFFGYEMTENFDLILVKPIQRSEDGVVIGLHNLENLPKITRILEFLTKAEFRDLSALFFLMLCKAMKESPEFKHIVKTSLVLQDWIKTQPYLSQNKYVIEEKVFGEEIASWEKSRSVEEGIPIQVAQDAWDE